MKRILLPVIALVLVSITIWVIYSRTSGTVREELKDFAVKDTAAITKIFLSDRSGNSILLTRKAGTAWMVNDSFPARKETMKLLLEVIYRVDVRTRVSKSGYNNVIKDLASSGIKCEIYLDDPDQPEKTYYVGGHTQDALGTFMMIENSSMPFVTEIPGFNGYLTPWYPTKLSAWKDQLVFSYRPEEVKEISITYPAYPEFSFLLKRQQANYQLSAPDGGLSTSAVDTLAVQNFFALLKSIPYEEPNKKLSPTRIDSLMKSVPSVIYSIKNSKGTQTTAVLYPMEINERSITRDDSLGNPLKYDLDHMLAYLEPSREWVVVQHYTFDPILRKRQDFDLSRGKSTATRR